MKTTCYLSPVIRLQYAVIVIHLLLLHFGALVLCYLFSLKECYFDNLLTLRKGQTFFSSSMIN